MAFWTALSLSLLECQLSCPLLKESRLDWVIPYSHQILICDGSSQLEAEEFSGLFGGLPAAGQS